MLLYGLGGTCCARDVLWYVRWELEVSWCACSACLRAA
jgi:hypothetical protein